MPFWVIFGYTILVQREIETLPSGVAQASTGHCERSEQWQAEPPRYPVRVDG
jgi:hypothetical protein